MHAEAERTADYRAGVIAALLANAHSGGGSEVATPGTFFPSLADLEDGGEELTVEDTKAYVRQLMAGLARRTSRKRVEA